MPFNLPPELNACIFVHLDVQSILRCRQVCSAFCAVIDHNVSIQYIIELAAANIEDGPPGNDAPAERLELLKAHQEAMMYPHWNLDQKVSMEGHAWELIGGVLGVATTVDTLHFHQLPSNYRRLERKEWTISNKGFKLEDFSMDQSQDLLVVIQRQFVDFPTRFIVHLLSLSSGNPHPSATKLEYCLIASWRTYDIRIFEDYLGILVYQDNDRETDVDELVIWNWKTGKIVLNVEGVNLYSFAFLTETMVMLGVMPTTGSPRLQVIDLSTSTSERVNVDSMQTTCCFILPALRARELPASFHIQSESPPVSYDHASSVPFATSRDDRLFVVSIRGRKPRNITMFIPLSTLLFHIRRLPGHIPGGPRSHAFLWTDWGPQGTRALAMRTSMIWLCYVHGLKFITRTESGRALILDFNQYAVRKRADGHSGMNSSTQFLMEPTTINKGLPFEFTTSLPYRMVSCNLPPPISYSGQALMLSEDAIVALSPDESEFQILSF
ncbi:hypothetical protein Hypma_010243 [Hypsizygus marmoreus]|uniref:F-box domain-containing protein n=1 Tax=Hypsizygus marmoreus TaxID=39966 RepID=A0A369JT85_HYPMA|nr:hypothetical protein Hypma_010243 [Hypsizygus marmoreus]